MTGRAPECKEKEFGFGFLHVKPVDECGHDGLLDERRHWLRKSDEMLALFLEKFKE